MYITTKYYTEVVNKIQSLNNKLTKYDYEPIEYTVINTEVISGELVYTLELSNPSTIKLGDYTLIAKLTHGQQFIIHTHSNLTTDFFRDYSEPHCEHCKTNHKRIKTYIVYNNATGDYIQLGTACVSVYLGYDVELALRMTEAYYDMLDEIATEENNGKRGTSAFDLTYILRISKYFVDEYGYIKKDEFNSTYTNVMDYICNTPFVLPEYDITPVIEYFQTVDTTSTYNHNCSEIAKTGYVTTNNLGIAISMYSTYKKAMESKRLKQTGNIPQYVGNVGDKLQLNLTVAKTLYSLAPFAYGAKTRHCYMLVDAHNNVYIWTTDKMFDSGETLTGKASLIEHKEYNGVKQNVITRFKIV